VYDSSIQGDILQSQRLSLELPTWRNFSICLAEPDDQKAAAEGSGTGGAGSGQNDPNQGKPAEPDPTVKIAALTEEKDRHFKKTQDQEAELNELRKIRDEVEQAKLTDAEKIKAEVATKDQRITGLEEVNRRLALQNAFLVNNSVQWHDTAAALKLVDLSAVEVKDGEVTNPDVLKAAIKTLADANPWMVAEPEQKKKAPPKTGDAPNGAKPDPTSPDFEALAAKFPALRHHRTY
jgi:hypothetical protein